MNFHVPSVDGDRAGDVGTSQTLSFSAASERCQSKRSNQEVPRNASVHLDFMDCYFGSTEKELHMAKGPEPQEHTVQKEGVTFAGGRQSVVAVDMPLCNLPPQEDEMLSLLQYPLVDSFERNSCSEDVFGGPSSNVRTHTMKDKQKNVSHSSWREARASYGWGSIYCNTGNRAVTASRALTTDASMALGAQRAAGHIAQDGVEVFKRVRANFQQASPRQETFGAKITTSLAMGEDCSSLTKLPSISNLLHCEESGPSFRPCALANDIDLPQKTIDESASSPTCLNSPGALIFCPVSNVEANLHLDEAHGVPTHMGSVRKKESLAVNSRISMGEANLHICDIDDCPVRMDSTNKQEGVTAVPTLSMDYSWSMNPKTKYFPSVRFTGKDQTLGAVRKCVPLSVPVPTVSLSPSHLEPDSHSRQLYSTMRNALLQSMAESSASVAVDLCSAKECDPSFRTEIRQDVSSASPDGHLIGGSVHHRHEDNVGKGKVDPGALVLPSSSLKASDTICSADVTTVSSSDESSEKSEKDTTTSSSKKRMLLAEQAECHIKDSEEKTVTTKKPSKGAPSVGKRTRAAEIHNLSEKKRRNKINLKMKALQELIPNANKTDKASMLEEAIEYLKTLQAQLQFMSMRTGIAISPMILPAGMQFAHLQQTLAYPQMNMGMGMGTTMEMGMGMGMGASVGAGAAVSVAAGVSPTFGVGHSTVAMSPVTGQPMLGHVYHVGGVCPGVFAPLYSSPSIMPSGCMIDQQQQQAFGQTPLSNMHMNPDALKAFKQQQHHQQQPQHREHP